MTTERTTSEITRDLRDLGVDLARWLNPAANLLFESADKLDDLRAEADKHKKAAFACQHEVNIVRARCASAERLLAQEGEALKAARAELAKLRPADCGDPSHVHIGPYCTPVANEQVQA